MKITTTHTLAFSMRTKGSDQYTAASQIVLHGADGFGLRCTLAPLPLPEGSDPAVRNTQAVVASNDKAELEVYAKRVDETLTFIGVELGD